MLRAEPLEESSSHSLEISLLILDNIFQFFARKDLVFVRHFFLFVDTNFSKKSQDLVPLRNMFTMIEESCTIPSFGASVEWRVKSDEREVRFLKQR